MRRIKIFKIPPLKRLVLKNLGRIFFVLFPYGLTLGLGLALFGVSLGFAQKSDLFTLRRVSLNDGRRLSPDAAWRFASLKMGQPILRTDLGRIERFIRERNPEFLEVQVHRVLPDEIRLDLKPRQAMAQMEGRGIYVLVDEEGMVISGISDHPFGALPVIRGTAFSKAQLKKGNRLSRQALNQAIQLLRDIRKFDVLRGHRLSLLDISDPKNFILILNDRLEIRMASRDLGSQVKKMADVLAHIDLDPDKIRYIDLRFDDVVISPQ